MKIVAIVQARMDSTRLPGKVMKEIVGKPLLQHLLERLKRSRIINQVVVATSEEDTDLPIADFCQKYEIDCFRGSKDDVLDRYYQTAKRHRADVIVRITGDCPLIDPVVVDETIQYYLDNNFDYVSNANPPTFPDGLDTEVFNFLVLEGTWKGADKEYQREHVTPFIVENDNYSKGNLRNNIDISHMRWCVDREEDLELIKKIFNFLSDKGNNFTMDDVVSLINSQPTLATINNEIGRNEGFLKSLSKEGLNPERFRSYFKKGIAESNRLYLRELTLTDTSESYVDWLNDPDVNRFMESRFVTHSIESLKEYVKKMQDDENTMFLAIIDSKEEKHIGNIKIDSINRNHNYASLGIMIGEKSYWGKGYGTEAIKLVVKYCFDNLKMHKIIAYVSCLNFATFKAFEKAGFSLEGRMKEKEFIDGNYCDELIYGIVNRGEENMGASFSGKKIKLTKSFELWERGAKIIPNGTQTASKSPDQFVHGAYPIYIQGGKGSHVFDVDGNEYIDYPCSLGTIILGHSYPAVVEAICDQAEEGIIFSLMHPLEVEVAEMLVNQIPCAESVRFVKNGSDATSMAVRIARAYTGKDKIAACGYHGWQDWYIVSTEKNKGVPLVFKDHIYKFKYNDLESLKKIFDENKNQVAAVIMEPVVLEDPTEGFLEKVKELAHENNALLIFDEMVTGFRYSLGGAQEYYDTTPDLGCFGKSVANGMPLSIIAGKKKIMDECYHIFQSTTFGGEAVSLAAARATLKELKNKDVLAYIWNLGKKLQQGLKNLSQETGVKFEALGKPPRQYLLFKDDKGYSSLEIKTLFLQETIKRGVLMGNAIFLTYSHSEEDIDATLKACEESLKIIRKALDEDNLRFLIEGKMGGEVFRKKAES